MCESDFTQEGSLGVEVTLNAVVVSKGKQKGKVKIDKDIGNWEVKGLRCMLCDHRISSYYDLVESLTL